MTYPLYPDLKGKTVFITGGGAGIGAACVSGFIQAGAQVGFVSRSVDQGKQLCSDLEHEYNQKPLFIACDICNISDLQQAIHKTAQNLGDIDVLINNAARDDRHKLDDYSVEQWDDSLNTNLRPHFFTTQMVAAGMRQKGGGSIIQMGSNSSILGLSGYPAYVTAKAGIIGLCKALARELGGDGIRVNALIPGWVMTKRQRELWVTDEALNECLAQQCLKATIQEEDIVNAALFLASSASAMMTGQSLIVDGGRV